MPEKRERTTESARAVGDEIRKHTADLVVAYNAADLDRTLAYFAPDAIYMPADRPAMLGVELLRKHLSHVFASGVELVALTCDEFASAGEVVMQRGHYLRRVPRGDHHTVEQRGTYEATWRLQPDEEYRVTSLIFGHRRLESDGLRRP
jgi:ketosteroid isomerase-like protein